MLKFMPNPPIADNTVIDKIILETQLNVPGDPKITVSQFKGAVVVDPNLGNYVVIDFTVTDTTAINIGCVRLNHGETLVAVSEAKDLSIIKEEGKNLKVRLAAQFDGAEKCRFNTTSVNLPYATPFREGVVRFYNGEEFPKSGIVYSAADVDAKIAEIKDSLGNLTDYAKKAEQNEFTAANTFTAGITVNGEISGDAVTDAGTGGDKHIVNVGYADSKYLSLQAASSVYLTKTEAGNTYLTKTDASSTYLTQTTATATYLSKTDAESAAGNYAKLNASNEFATGTTNTFNGDVTVKGIFAVGESQNAAEFAVTSTGISGTLVNNDKVSSAESNKLPTEGAVKSALNDVESALQSKDNDLQSQIDGINAGQNLADIVDTTEALKAYDISHLKAKDDYQRGTSGATWKIGDKVQVLGGADVQSSVYELVKGTIPTPTEGEESKDIQSTKNTNYYWRYIGVYGTNAYTKSEIDKKVSEINNTLGTKADTSYVNTELANKANSADVYTTTAADGKFAVKTGDNTFTGNNTFNGYIIGNAVTSDIAEDIKGQGVKLTTSSGVSSFVNSKITELNLGGSYLKLSSGTPQEVNSSVVFNGVISGTAVAAGKQQSADGNKLVTVAYANEKFSQLAAENTFTGATNTFQAITATTVSANTFTGDGVTNQISPDGGRLPTEHAVSSFVGSAIRDNRDAIANKTQVGAMGLFLYTGNDFKEMGTEVAGTLLQAVGMQLPMDGVVSWSQGAAMEGQWKLLNNTIAGEPCLVLAIRVG